MGVDHRGGGPERRNQQNYFDSANTFNEIINLISKAPEGSLKDSKGNEIDATIIVGVKRVFENKDLVGSDLINYITRNNGLREAVVRAMAPNFDMENNLNNVWVGLKAAEHQNNELKGVNGSGGKQLCLMTDSSGNPVDIGIYIQVLEQIMDFLKKNPTDKIPNENQYFAHFTSKYGLRGAIQRGVATLTGDTGRFTY
ncbi:MAG: hypothetical protein A2534_05325 [Candidatus Magasanikbacteria bacterium RIFOXYD2_FULL_39_9]|uniref:Uncharacterized protein n=1 Tax=Candidatus Magasanikbacteria bacterium RIFOXYD1_FULL_40_23 TaxID=1798705 RepID=A0A1F6P9Q4_9BACT|nr:MAG: hypothetical protein A2534_05325 [Candidatus Magasanikbacteria bacterium RIFOXYD2_FULL_39_9]OGH92683.1 MAG: hypothetical protein A2563_03350 [Candidatus Magasanikbacteria bacterium RIFOXYD1_FULL_40_23]